MHHKHNRISICLFVKRICHRRRSKSGTSQPIFTTAHHIATAAAASIRHNINSHTKCIVHSLRGIWHYDPFCSTHTLTLLLPCHCHFLFFIFIFMANDDRLSHIIRNHQNMIFLITSATIKSSAFESFTFAGADRNASQLGNWVQIKVEIGEQMIRHKMGVCRCVCCVLTVGDRQFSCKS